MRLDDKDIVPRWSLYYGAVKVGLALFHVLLFLGCGKLMAPGY